MANILEICAKADKAAKGAFAARYRNGQDMREDATAKQQVKATLGPIRDELMQLVATIQQSSPGLDSNDLHITAPQKSLSGVIKEMHWWGVHMG